MWGDGELKGCIDAYDLHVGSCVLIPATTWYLGTTQARALSIAIFDPQTIKTNRKNKQHVYRCPEYFQG